MSKITNGQRLRKLQGSFGLRLHVKCQCLLGWNLLAAGKLWYRPAGDFADKST